ncbi:unnamed protein product [Lathyrus sativus]|nr:unnamed protein product [Lathyrus sativus]
MMISWNVRGINNSGKCQEVVSLLKQMDPKIAIPLKTRVKPQIALKVRNKSGQKWKMIDNYSKHNNGRIWILCDETRIKVTTHTMSTQFIYCIVY